VFLDANANGQLDAGETGVAGVPVTDGVGFAVTGPDGRYALDAQLDPLLQPEAKPILTVSFPSGTWPTAGWFRRLDEAKDPKAVHFGLRREEQALPFVFVHATDPHVPRGGKQRFLDFRADAEALAARAKFCVLTGDLVDLADECDFKRGLADFQFYAEATRGFPLPLFAIPGNHDCAGIRPKAPWPTEDPLFAYGMYGKFVGPLRWSFHYAGHHFVGIDFNTRENGKWKWGVPPSAVAWLERDLAFVPKGMPVLLFVHAPQGGPELTRVIRAAGVRWIFGGHSHAARPLAFAGARGWESGSLGQTGRGLKLGYRLALVSRGSVETFYKPTGEVHPIAVDSPRPRDVLRGKATVRGAFYDAEGEIERLTVRVGDAGGAVAFRRTPICCRFEAEVDLSALPEGQHDLRIELAKGQQTWSWERKHAVGRDE
jgi:hypothetical protein